LFTNEKPLRSTRSGSKTMLKHHLKTSIRNLAKGKLFTLINITGLAVGMTCFTVLTLFVIDELNFDRYHENADDIYRVYIHISVNGGEETNSKAGAPLGPALLKEFPEVINYTRMSQFTDPVFRYKDKAFREWSVFGVDPGFLEIFTVKMLEGDKKSALDLPNSIVLTASMAQKYFGGEESLGKTLTTENGDGYVVTGVIEDFPANTHMGGNFLIPISNNPKIQKHDWLSNEYTTYIVLQKGVDPQQFEKKLKTIVDTHIAHQVESTIGISMQRFYADGNKYDIKIQPLRSIYLHSKRKYGIDMNTDWSEFKSGDIAYVYLFSTAALFILLIAVLNFINLSTARSEKRSKEVGVRKTVGAGRVDLILQFLLESIMISTISALISLVLTELFLPFFNQLTGKMLSLQLITNPSSLLVALAGVILIGLLNGVYPALFLSSFKPIHVLKSGCGKSNRKGLLRSVLVVFQFSISVTLLIGTLLIKSQVDFMSNKDLGFNKEQLITVYNADFDINTQHVIKQEFLKNPHINSATFSSEMFRYGIPACGYFYENSTTSGPILSQYVDVDYDFLNTYEIDIKEGRFFNEDFSPDVRNIVVNEALLKDHALIDPIGKTMQRMVDGKMTDQYRIIGVIKDFNYESLHRNIRPLVLHLNPGKHNQVLTLRLDPANLSDTFSYLEKTWIQITGNEHFYYRFLDANLERLYRNEKKVQLTAGLFSCLAIFVACLGLYGNAVFMTEQKTKEVGIRKALGASVIEISLQISKQFSKWVIIANLVAWPVTYLLIDHWLKDFAYRIEIGWGIFILSGFISLFIALLTVSYQTIKTSLSNPVDALKYE
jgi:putative ABC transport system permease protein